MYSCLWLHGLYNHRLYIPVCISCFVYAAYIIAENVFFTAERIKISKKLTVATCAVCKKNGEMCQKW